MARSRPGQPRLPSVQALTDLEEQLGLIANGLLLGGLFTLLYSLGSGLASGSSKYRFLIMGMGLIVALVLGYQKFILPGQKPKKSS